MERTRRRRRRNLSSLREDRKKKKNVRGRKFGANSRYTLRFSTRLASDRINLRLRISISPLLYIIYIWTCIYIYKYTHTHIHITYCVTRMHHEWFVVNSHECFPDEIGVRYTNTVEEWKILRRLHIRPAWRWFVWKRQYSENRPLTIRTGVRKRFG